VIEARDAVGFGKIGIGGLGENVYTVHHGDVAAVVSKTPVFISILRAKTRWLTNT